MSRETASTPAPIPDVRRRSQEGRRGRDPDQSRRYRATRQKIAQLNEAVRALGADCARTLAAEPHVDEAYATLRRLSPLFSEVLSFVAVIGTQVDTLEEPRRTEAMEQLALLERHLARLELETSATLMDQLAASTAPRALGTRHVLERWLARMEGLEEKLDQDGQAQLEHMRALARAVADGCPDLPDFSTAHVPAGEGGRVDAVPLLARAPVVSRPDTGTVQLAFRTGEKGVHIDPGQSHNLAAEVRRLKLQVAIAAVLDITPANVALVLTGHDPFRAVQATALADVLRRHIGADRLVVSGP
ncbi:MULTISPECIES: hypothetical protein [Nitrospirillum]|uniref:Uncharacterized protein n=1 Tax=Nitrospirillum amazonense TaxID=28077 RepID=A0A560FUT3_9PROT|nr:hypothetical protein [Nitrospirillum amazonense]MEC4595175.1 hypothetical protein [Nitrospirillum amazonense]TWB25374.1 hypothetical protein FBZ88_110131 [Nitrospirillum amazonense]